MRMQIAYEYSQCIAINPFLFFFYEFIKSSEELKIEHMKNMG